MERRHAARNQRACERGRCLAAAGVRRCQLLAPIKGNRFVAAWTLIRIQKKGHEFDEIEKIT